ncbi:PAS domain S-box-containing protein [Flavobacteriaceae bacterium MAR_2010_188]|nr:PAS domain S-box-containing protein [Flavobacteriaceae bacterium MAR_2010_188]
MKVYNTDFSLSKKQKEPLLDYLQEAAIIGLWKVDLSTAMVNWCPITRRIHEVDDNYEPSFDKAINFYKPGENQEKITELVQDCYTNFTKYDVELQIITAKGNEKWVRAIGLPVVENGKCIALHGLFQDIDEKTQLLKKLALKEEQFRKTFEYAVLGMAMLNLEGQWIKVNKALVNMLGYNQSELSKLTFHDLTHHEERHLHNTKRLISGRIENYQAEKRLIHKNGDVVYTIVSVSLVRDDMGKPLNFVAQINDMSDFRKASDKVIQLLKTSESQNKRLLNFAHIVSHNLSSHYSNIDMLLKLMELEAKDMHDSPICNMISEAVRNLGETLENLSDVAVINTSTKQEVSRVNLLNYVNLVITQIHGIILQNRAKIVVDVNEGLYVKVIPAYLESILLNLLSNAIKYKSEDRELHIEISAKRLHNFVQINVKDNGMDIDLKTQGSKVFGMYKTFHNHEDSRGLGLFITKNQVDAMEGEISVVSEVNTGSNFKILLKDDED